MKHHRPRVSDENYQKVRNSLTGSFCESESFDNALYLLLTKVDRLEGELSTVKSANRGLINWLQGNLTELRTWKSIAATGYIGVLGLLGYIGWFL